MEKGHPDEDDGEFWPDWLKPKRIAEFAGNVWRMERAVEELRQERGKLRADLETMQQQLAVQAKQLELLTSFIQTSLTDRVDMRAENAALKLLMSVAPKVRQPDD